MEYQKKDKRVKYLFEPKKGTAAARHKGEINSQGEIILMTDSDCIVPKNWIEEMIEPILVKKAIAVQGPKKAVSLSYWSQQTEEEEKKSAMKRLNDNKIGLLDTANFAIKKSILKEIGYTNPAVYSVNDTELDARIKIRKYKIFFKDFSVLHYHPTTAINIFKKYFKRGELNMRLIKTYKTHQDLFCIHTIISHLQYLIGLCAELLRLDKSFRYHLVSGMGWRAGYFYAYFFKKGFEKIDN